MIKRLLGRSGRMFFNLVDRPAVILLYHRVTDPANDPQLLCVGPENFYDHIDLLKKGYVVLEIEEFTGLLLKQKKIPRNTVVITFDDGYADNRSEALPILESLSAQALFYVATANIDTDAEFWWDELEGIFFHKNFSSPRIILNKGVEKIHFSTTTMTERLKTYHALHPILKYSLPGEIDKIITDLKNQTGVPLLKRSSHKHMTTIEIKELSASNSAVIGAHTHRHPSLALLTYKDQFEEIRKSKEILEQITGRKIEHFSYPYGSKADYNKSTMKICRELKFKMVCSNFYGQVHRWTDILQVPRMLVRNWPREEFKGKIETFFKF